MSNSRRTFIKDQHLQLLAVHYLSRAFFCQHKHERRASWSAFNFIPYGMIWGKILWDTLKQLAAMGYKHVEHANYKDRKFYGYTPTEFKKILDELGIKMPKWTYGIGFTTLGCRKRIY